ncbi:HDOD domain-containing protein [Oceanispirochaeta crateris]|jgi:putative nucleotidyltransferase with HDIG domain|uniref:HDOD domain-containing protein n=1 Tax=Oceanispirochaeta crateris TaxID=2518645 RepID=A0A5C1QNI5_9SPIO|nr:HDOD domain-containing protein [Oceanispirochaeta crateris]QEN09231.1 HDOD domain-containing protein [Oceanispirochaeta crateris]
MPPTNISDKIKIAIQKSVPVTVTSYKLNHDTEVYLEDILGVYLRELGQETLVDRLAYCLKELAVNAKKANTKRVYFEEKGLSLDSKDDYQEGMKNFKSETMDRIDHYLELQKQKGLYVKVTFHTFSSNFRIAIRNNVQITRKEQMRIYDRIARSRAFDSMEEAFSEVLDDSEGAGLGIVILILMLKKMGLDEEAFEIDGNSGETIASLTIPIAQVKLDEMDMLTSRIVSEIEALPQFPENITVIQQLINDPNSDINEIARRISTDPSLTADLLRVVNSAKFMLPNRVDNIADAVKMVGLRGLKNLLYSYGSEKILNLPQKKELWDHAHRTAFYSFSLARNVKLTKDFIDDAYVGGILHDMGKIVFSSIHPELLEKIQEFATEKSLSAGLFENLAGGFNHAQIGAKIAEKWNFSESLVQAIRYHHEPHFSKPEYRKVVNCVYLANALCDLEKQNIVYDQLDKDVLKFFRITSEVQLDRMKDILAQAFKSELMM